MLKIKSEAGVCLRRIGALYAAYGQVKGNINGGFDVFFVQQRPEKCRRKHVPRPVKHISQNGGNDVLRTAMRVLRSNNFARRIQSFPWKQIQPHHLIITNAKRTARLFSRSPLMCLYYILILPIAHKEVRRVVPTVRMLAYRHRHCGIGLCQNISPMPRRIHPNLRNKICPARFPRCARAVLAPV